jgi:DNA-binding CsgD family transcriptional regulator
MLDDADRRPLSSSEADVLRLVAEGLTNQEIAEELGKRPGTVKTQLASARRVVGASSRAAAAAWWARNNPAYPDAVRLAGLDAAPPRGALLEERLFAIHDLAVALERALSDFATDAAAHLGVPSRTTPGTLEDSI